MEKVIQYPQIGSVRYVKSKRARRISISIHLQKGVTVTLPYYGDYAEAELFVAQKRDWILKSIQKVKQIEDKQTVFTPEAEYRTKFRELKLIPEARKNLRLHVSDKFVEIYYPEQMDVMDEGVQNAIKKAMEHTWRIEAHEYLPARLKELAEEFNLSYKSLTIKNIRSYWGCCDVDNSIILNIHLMHLPYELIDYVILHELCHTVHKNHGRYFWALLDRVTQGKARFLEKETKKHSTRIY